MTTRNAALTKPNGKLGVLLPGMGAVATTFLAGVEMIRRGHAKPIGSVTQLATIRLGKRTDRRSPRVKDFVPLAELDDLVFGGWDPLPDSAYESAKHAGVLSNEHIESVRPFLEAIRPMPAVFQQSFVRRLQGENVKRATSKMDLAHQLMDDIARFKRENDCQRCVAIWCGST
jgi:myo-inositol-1-phosphate synthase